MEEKEKPSPEDIIGDVNLLVGAVDGRTVERVRRIVRYMIAYQGAYLRQRQLFELSENHIGDYTQRRLKELHEELNADLRELDRSLGI